MTFLKNYFRLPSIRLIASLLVFSIVFIACEDDVVSSGDLREEYTGQWTCHEQSEQYGESDYFISISKGVDEDHIDIFNFYNLGETESVSVFIEDNSLIISDQSIKGNEISGSGNSNIGFSNINFSYEVNDGAEIDHVTAQYTR